MSASLYALAAAFAIASVSAQPSGSCATNGKPCPPPTWTPVWNLTMSTICQPSSTGYFQPPAAEPWGLISLDWSVARSIWSKNGLHNGTIEATSREGCRLIKLSSPSTKCFIYHNMELALESMESQRAVMYNPATADYFLLRPNGSIYNERQSPGVSTECENRLDRESYALVRLIVATAVSDELRRLSSPLPPLLP